MQHYYLKQDNMQSCHQLSRRPHCGFCSALNEQFEELDIQERCVVNRIILIIALVDFIGSLRYKIFHAVPSPSLAGYVQQGPLLLPWQPMIFALLRKKLKYVDLEQKNCSKKKDLI